jgi:hypothetical protein
MSQKQDYVDAGKVSEISSSGQLSRIEIRAKKEFDETKLNLSIYNKSNMKKVSVMEAELRID